MEAPDPQCGNFIILLSNFVARQTSATNDVGVYHHSQSKSHPKSHDRTRNQSRHYDYLFINIAVQMPKIYSLLVFVENNYSALFVDPVCVLNKRIILNNLTRIKGCASILVM